MAPENGDKKDQGPDNGNIPDEQSQTYEKKPATQRGIGGGSARPANT